MLRSSGRGGNRYWFVRLVVTEILTTDIRFDYIMISLIFSVSKLNRQKKTLPFLILRTSFTGNILLRFHNKRKRLL